MHLVSQTLLNNNPTWAAQKKNKVLISISFQAKSLSNRECCILSLVQCLLALEAQLCLGWGSEGCRRHVEARRFCLCRNRGHAIRSVTEGQTICGIPDSHSKNQETQTKLFGNLISEGAYSPTKTFIQEIKTFNTNEM